MRRSSCLATLLACATLLPAQAPKQKITRAADLPVFTYKIDGTVEDVLQSEEKFNRLAAEIRKNIESVLATYEIEDKGTLRDLVSTLATLDLLEGRDAEAMKLLDQAKALQEKPAAALLSGLTARAIINSRAAIKEQNSTAFRQAIYRSIRQSLDGMPFEVIENDLKSQKARMEMISSGLIVGQVQAVMDPAVTQNNGSLSSDMAHALPNMRFTLQEILPLKANLIEVYGGYLAAHNV
jgi:hypothetical protein